MDISQDECTTQVAHPTLSKAHVVPRSKAHVVPLSITTGLRFQNNAAAITVVMHLTSLLVVSCAQNSCGSAQTHVALPKAHVVALSKAHVVALSKAHVVALSKTHVVALSNTHVVALPKAHMVPLSKAHVVLMSITTGLQLK